MKIALPVKHRKELESQLKKARHVDERLRLSCVLLYDESKAVKDIAHFLYLSEDTVYNYINDFHKNNKTKNDDRGGGISKLTTDQEKELKTHLQDNTYLKTNAIIQHIESIYGIRYTISGVTKMLNRLGFCYKRPSSIPGRLNVLKQEQFKEEYKQLKSTLGKDEEILFMDSVHPEYQSQSVRGWILKGKVKHLQTTAKQYRLHYTGSICLENKKIITQHSETVNEDVIIEFLKKIEASYPEKVKIYVICDNAMYHKSKKVKKWLEDSKIELRYLPGYSPNLNPIERLWKILREKACYNKYYSSFVDFKDKIAEFFEQLDRHKDVINSRINDNFQVFKPNLINLAK